MRSPCVWAWDSHWKTLLICSGSDELLKYKCHQGRFWNKKVNWQRSKFLEQDITGPRLGKRFKYNYMSNFICVIVFYKTLYKYISLYLYLYNYMKGCICLQDGKQQTCHQRRKFKNLNFKSFWPALHKWKYNQVQVNMDTWDALGRSDVPGKGQ